MLLHNYLTKILFFCQDYRHQKHVVATQLPLPDTVTDFWKVMEEKRVTNILQLEEQVGSLLKMLL